MVHFHCCFWCTVRSCEVKSTISFFWLWISSPPPNTICWEDSSFPIELSWYHCQKAIDSEYKYLSLDQRFCSIQTCSSLLWLCRGTLMAAAVQQVLKLRLWILQVCLLFQVSCGILDLLIFLWILRWACQFLQKQEQGFC